MKNFRIKLFKIISIILILVSVHACNPSANCGNGIQDGNEIAVDCGGDCPSCGTCSDGIMNGTETAIDCGGTCSSCSTCSDGIMNGSETAIDCGGACSPCLTVATCTDGIMNGYETGVDCGGSCATCPPFGSYMYGLYTGTTTGPMIMIIPGASIDLDTNIIAPGVNATYEISTSDYIDSINIKLKVVISGTPIFIRVMGNIDTDTSYTISNYNYTYLGIIKMVLNGSGSVNGNNLTANLVITNGANPTGTITNGDLDFIGNR